MSDFFEQFQTISLYQWSATVFSLIYIYYAVRNESICFVFGLIGAAFWAYESYYMLNLKYDAFLQIFYVIMSVYGIYVWAKGGSGNEERKIETLGLNKNILLTIIGALLVFFISKIPLETSRPIIDLCTTVFSILATFLLVYRFLDNWIYWIFIDLIYAYIYWLQGGYLFTMIMFVYTVMAIIGYVNWRKIYLDKV